MNEYLLAFKRWNDFDGRSSRREYWMFVLVNVLIATALGLIDDRYTGGKLIGLYNLILLVPGVAVTTRRLHDINKSGWWQLVGLIPIIGWIWLIVLAAKEGDQGPNNFGN